MTVLSQMRSEIENKTIHKQAWLRTAYRYLIFVTFNPPGSKASREVANLTERKNLQ